MITGVATPSTPNILTFNAKSSSISCTELKSVQFWLIFVQIWLPWQLAWLPRAAVAACLAAVAAAARDTISI